MTTITPDNYKKFKTAYKTACAENRDRFTFDGAVVLTAYAKYLCEYIDGQIERNRQAREN